MTADVTLDTWRQLVQESFFELAPNNVGTVMDTFNSLELELNDCSLVEHLSFIIGAAKAFSIPGCVEARSLRLWKRSDPSHEDVLSPSALLFPDDLQATHRELLNLITPYLASEFSGTAAFSVALITRLSPFLTQEQLLDVVINLVNANDIFLSLQTSALCAATVTVIALQNICTELIEQTTELHAGVVLALQALLRAFRTVAKLSGTVDDPCDCILFLRVVSAACSRLIRSPQLALLSHVDNTDILTGIAADLHGLFRLLSTGSSDELSLCHLVLACRETVMVQVLMRTPNYLSAFLSLFVSLLLSSRSSNRLRGACRGFLTPFLLADMLLQTDPEEPIDQEAINTVIHALRTAEPQALRGVVEVGYRNYLSNCGIPLRAARPLNIISC
ncbi:hypothetical protein GMRT_15898 [Giardia muris]|uniref:Uncharacterized protein n=1 Tax=Giardia muris TaxID=5742 RepID=A0A4Z1T9T6_GIAMU|nr:hypothetical protein GMRT_15898 [Giardia muris]|eukprot:TNJ29947.1 hypothetical protein GMRT_15898 [Giardia muris]